ncbi:hypothetical protein CSPX01_11039 [Colletotrichum filicis]|nr:hypothetical protein CSPX01_11039 [Colletotrichum filicis]
MFALSTCTPTAIVIIILTDLLPKQPTGIRKPVVSSGRCTNQKPLERTHISAPCSSRDTHLAVEGNLVNYTLSGPAKYPDVAAGNTRATDIPLDADTRTLHDHVLKSDLRGANDRMIMERHEETETKDLYGPGRPTSAATVTSHDDEAQIVWQQKQIVRRHVRSPVRPSVRF